MLPTYEKREHKNVMWDKGVGNEVLHTGHILN